MAVVSARCFAFTSFVSPRISLQKSSSFNSVQGQIFQFRIRYTSLCFYTGLGLRSFLPVKTCRKASITISNLRRFRYHVPLVCVCPFAVNYRLVTYFMADIDVEILLPRRFEVDGFSTASGKSWALVLRWMHDCLRNHPRCNDWSTSEWWPTRLLDIESQSDARLIETSETLPSGPYLTLNHRWGTAEFVKLTTENLANMKAGIPYQSFPKTFRDAVIVAKRFKIRYIWIDSLYHTKFT